MSRVENHSLDFPSFPSVTVFYTHNAPRVDRVREGRSSEKQGVGSFASFGVGMRWGGGPGALGDGE